MKHWFWFLCLCPCLTAGGLNEPQNIRIVNGCVKAAPVCHTVWDYSKEGGQIKWDTVDNYENNLQIRSGEYFGRQALIISCNASRRMDTAFDFSTRPLIWGQPAMYHIEFDVASTIPTGGFGSSGEKYRNRIAFFDCNGKKVAERTFSYVTPLMGYGKINLVGRFPENAVALALHIGGDQPDIRRNQLVAYANLRIRYFYDQGNWARISGFTSRIFPLKDKNFFQTLFSGFSKPKIVGKVTGQGAKVRFQIATAGDAKGFPASFSSFTGPDGTAQSWFENDAELPEFAESVKWIRYRVQMQSSELEPAELHEVYIAGQRDGDWTTLLDVTPPEVALISKSPVDDGLLPLEVQLTDESGLDWPTLRVKLDGKDIRPQIVATGKGFRYCPTTPLAAGLHNVKVKVKDLSGNRLNKTLFFLIGKTAKRGVVTLRDDGLTLVDGKPFFPIGIYNVRKCPANSQNFDRAFRELKQAGFNFVHTYQTRRNANFREFITTAGKYGFKVWIAGNNGSNDASLKRIAHSLIPDRLNPALLAWYIGDDTLTYNTPDQLKERTELVKALAPHLITVHADSMRAKKVSRYRPFVHTSLAFMPEIYPITKSPQDNECVAKVIRDMKQAYRDAQDAQAGPRTFWPIIQYFQGWTVWKRFPTPQELRAMSYAAIISGAHGITWYTYAGYGKNYGASATPEHWDIMTALSREIAQLTPILIERHAKKQIKPEIITGAKTNSLGDVSVQALTKLYQGRCYIFAVNSVASPVKVSFDVGQFGRARTLYPTETVTIKAGIITADFAPFEVKIFELQ